MKTIPVLAAALAVTACSRGDDAGNQAGMAKGATGLQVNMMSAASECMSAPDSVRMVSCLNATTARQINAQLPRAAGEDLRLDRITTEGPLLTYHFTVARRAADLPAQFGQQLEAEQRRLICSRPEQRQTIGMGGAYGFRWVDNQGVLIREARIDAC